MLFLVYFLRIFVLFFIQRDISRTRDKYVTLSSSSFAFGGFFFRSSLIITVQLSDNRYKIAKSKLAPRARE